MTITSTPTEIAYAGNGSTTVFPIPFVFDTAADLKVIETDASGNPVEVTTGFSIGGGGGSTGDLTRGLPLPIGTTLTILDDPELTQDADYTANDSFPADVHEGALDHGVRISKRLYQLLQRAIRVADGDLSQGSSLIVPIASARQGLFLAFDANGNPVAASGTGGGDSALRTDLAKTISGADGARLVGYRRTEAGSVARSVYQILNRVFYVDDFVTNTVPGTTDVTSQIQAAYDIMPVNYTLEFSPTTYKISGAAALLFDEQKHIRFNGAIFNHANAASDIPFTFGPSAGGVFNVRIQGPVQVIRTAAISHNGTQTAASQLLGQAFKFQNFQLGTFEGGAFVQGWKDGYYFAGGTSTGKFYGLHSQDCLRDFVFESGVAAGQYVTGLDLFGVWNGFNPAFYSGVVGSRGAEAIRGGQTVDGIKFFGGVLEAAKERKVKWDGSYSTWFASYFDFSNGGTDIEFPSANAHHNRFLDGGGLELLVVSDSAGGFLNSIEAVKYVQQQTNGDIWRRFNGQNEIPFRDRAIGITLADDDQFQLPSNAGGFVIVKCGNESGGWNVNADGSVSKLFGTTNTVAGTTDGNLCVFDNGDHAAVQNRLGSSQKTMIFFPHWV